MNLYDEIKRLIELRQIGSVLSTLHTARISPDEEDLEAFYSTSLRLLSEALSMRTRRARQYLDRLIDKAYRTIDRGGVKIVGGKVGLASRPRFERILDILDKHNDYAQEQVKALRAVALYALYPKYKRVPTMSCSVRKYDGIIKLMQCFTSGRRCLEAYERLKEYNIIFTLRSILRAAYMERDLNIAREGLRLLHLGTPADKAELYILIADLTREEEWKKKAIGALDSLMGHCSGDYMGKINKAIDFSRTCSRIPRLKERLDSLE